MMMFQPEHVAPILSGRKTETRRLWKSQRVKVGSIQKAKLKMFSKDSFAHIRILGVWQERLGDISEESVWAEGYDTLEEYKGVLERVNKRRHLVWDDDLAVWAVKFELMAKS